MSMTMKEERIFASVLADGKFHVTVPEGTEKSVVRKYKTSDGKKEGEKHELVYSDLVGKITKVDIFKGSYGRQLQVTVVDGNDKPVVLSVGTDSFYGEDLMKKLMSINLDEYVKIVPYSFVDKNKKSKKGMTVWQKNKKTGENEKIGSYFYDAEKKGYLYGYPEAKKLKKERTSEQWRLHYAIVREFLVEQLTEHFKIEAKAPSSSLDDLANEANAIAKDL